MDDISSQSFQVDKITVHNVEKEFKIRWAS